MTLADKLEALRQDVPGCTLASFGDIASGLALRTSASRPHKQDYLEQILHQAARTFALSDASGQDDDRVLVATPDEVRIFVRCSNGSSDIVCCVCDDATALDHAARSARKILSDMSRAA